MIDNEEGFVSLETYSRLIKEQNLTFRQVEEKVFKEGLTPLRFKRNQNSITQKEQMKLFYSHVCVVGCGGLGGNVAELLARVGVGEITLFDDDVFCESNLNRQNFCTVKSIGESKAKVVAKNLYAINPALKVYVQCQRLTQENLPSLVDIDAVVECVDNGITKRLLANFCEKNKIHFIHGAIGGWIAQSASSTKIGRLYESDEMGVEKVAGNLAFSTSLCASFQVSLCVKLLLQKRDAYDTLYMYDLFNNELEKILL